MIVTPTLDYEKKLWNSGFSLVAGLDEVGRGCFAGPVIVGSVVVNPDCKLPQGIRDSKLLTPKKRQKLATEIKNCGVDWAIGMADVPVINEIGIGKATQLAFYNAIKSLRQEPQYILIDAFYIDNIDRNKQKPVVHGDGICLSIAAASIIAKVYRDQLMEQLSELYPEFRFDKHKGYGTQEHRDLIKKYGLSPLHRTSFNLEKFL